MKVKVVFCIVQGQSRRTHVARGGSNVQVTVLEDARYGSTTIKSCMGLICYSRPDLIPNEVTDYAISVLDVQETDAINQDNDKVWEGKGMMSWLLTEKGLGSKVIGRMTGTTEDSQMLEVSIELMPRTPILRKDLVQNLTSCSNIIETSLSRALLSQSKQNLLSHSNTSSPAADHSNTATPLPINNEENATIPTPISSEASSIPRKAGANVPADLPSMLQVLQASQPGLSMSHAMVILRNALNSSKDASSDASLLPSIDLLSASIASANGGDISVGQLGSVSQPAKHSLQARNKGLLEVLSAPDLSPATSDILSRFTIGFQNGNKAGPSNSTMKAETSTTTKTTRPYRKKDKGATNAALTSRKTSGTKRKASETIEISDTEGSRTNKALPDPIKPSTAAKASTSASLQPDQPKRLKVWEPGCLKCGRTASVGWRIRKKREKPLNGQKGDGNQEDDDNNVKKLCEECAQDLPSVQRRRKKEKDAALLFSEPLAPSSSMQPTPNQHAQARTIHTTQTSPLRRSPRRNKGKSAGSSGLAAVSLTSPIQAATNNGNKRRKFTTALSKAALSEENRNTSVPLAGDEDFEMTDSENTYLSISGSRGLTRGQSSPPRLQPMQNQSFDFMLDPASDLPDGFESSMPSIDTDFLMNASPGTAIRSALGGRGVTQSTPGNNESPGKMLSRYLKDLQRGGSLEGMNLDIPAFEDLQNNAGASRVNNNNYNDGNLFSPGGALSTPFRNAIFARATSEQPPSSHQRLQSQMNGGSANNPSSDEMTLGGDLQINLQPPSADRRFASSNLLKSASPSLAGNKAGDNANDAGHPPSDSLAIVDDFSTFLLNTSSSLFSPSPPRNGRIGSANSPLRRTLLPSYNSTGTSITKASLASLQLPTTLLRRNSAPHAPLTAAAPSSDFDIESNFDIRDLPPSSPPPLPSAHHSNMQIFLNSLGNNSLDDGQSPISATTSVTAGGTPQELLVAPKTETQHGLNQTFSLGNGSRNNDDWLDPSLRASSTYSHKASLSMDSAAQDDGDDSFFDLFTHAGSDNAKNATSTGGSTNMGLTWSDSTASSVSLSSMPNQLDNKVEGNRWKSNNTVLSASTSPVDFDV